MAIQAPSRAVLRSLRSLAYPQAPSRCLSCSRLLTSAPSPSERATTSSSSTHFGARTIPSSEKATRVGDVFTSVAPSYDQMNDLMSLGIHRLWKDYFVRHLDPGSPAPFPPQTILDVAGGTGDIALRMLEHMSVINGDEKSKVIVSDINPDMLREGEKRLQGTKYGMEGRISYLAADAEKFETIEDQSIDLYTVAFGIRNFTSIPTALKTAHRVLRPGGIFACLEFSHVPNSLLNAIYKRWSFGAIPLIGQLVAGDRDSYQYLVESIERFPDQRTFANMIKEAGFEVPGQSKEQGEEFGEGWVNLTGGVACIHTGIKPLR